MEFCSREYPVFFLVVFCAYWALRWQRARTILLLAVSFVFYAWWKWELACLIAVTTVADYVIARAMDSSQSERRRKALLIFSLVMNLGLLCYFKYANFFLDSAREALRSAGLPVWDGVLNVMLPVGISFYTFEAINYTVDVYRRTIKAERDLPSFMLFILFFPHLVAGPIVRARDFLPQVHRRKLWNWARIHLGVQFVLLGLFKKLAIADHLAQYVDPVFADPVLYKTSAIWMAVIAYAVQIYCDFSGYTDLALGSAHLLGFHLAKNFDMPYLAQNVSEFWRRWHISLSTWLRDYLFIPMGGSRGSGWQVGRNLFVTMLLGGLWHGASWHFVVWGALHGAFLIVHRGFKSFAEARPAFNDALLSLPGIALRMAITFGVVCVGWVFFRATSMAAAGTILTRLVTMEPGKSSPLQGLSLWVLLAVLAIGHVATASGWWRRVSIRIPAPALGAAYAVFLNLSLLLAPDSGKTFIYFQF